MKKYSNLFKRSQALILVVAMLLSVLNIGLWVNVSADDGVDGEVSVGEVIANNYELTAAEEALLSSGLLTGGSVSYTRPGDGLVSVDNDDKAIAAKSYDDETSGLTWEPVSADIVVNGEVAETVKLSDGKGTYTYGGKAFSVEVTYELKDSIDSELQETLLNAPAQLKQGIDNVDALEDGVLSVVEMAMPQLVSFSNKGYAVGSMTVEVADGVKASIKRLNDQMTANGGKLTLTAMLEAYNAAPVKYLLTEGKALKEEIDAFTADIDGINELLGTVKTMADLGVLDQATMNLVSALGNNLTLWSEAAAPVVKDEWAAAEAGTSLVAENLSDLGYDALETMIAAVTETTTVSEIKNPLVIETAAVQFNMNTWYVDVTVVLNKVTNNKVDKYDEITKRLTLSDGATAEEIRAAAEAVIDEAKAEWADFYAEGQFNEVADELPATLTSDLIDANDYTVAYSPKEYKVTTKYDGKEATLPYGYLLDLPVCEEAGKDFDYDVNGNKVAEGVAYQITENAVIDRTVGKDYAKSDLNQIVSDGYFAGGKAEAILTSGALTVGNVAVSVRYPDANDELVKIDENKLTAAPYASDYKGLKWMPYSYSVVVNGAAKEPVLFNGATEATIAQAAYDRVEVEYRLALTNVSEKEVLDLLNLPKVLADEAVDQKAALDRVSGYLGDMAQLNRSMLNGLKGTINGDPTISEEMKVYYVEIVDAILGSSIDAETGNLKIYNYLSVYVDENNGGLGYYYTNSAAVIEEINTLSVSLSAMLRDEETTAVLEKLLKDFNYEHYVDKIKNLESVMAEVKADLKAPNAAIDVESENLDKLVKALALEEELTSYEAAKDGAFLTTSLSIDAPTSKTVSATVQIAGKKGTTISKTFNFFDENGNEITVSKDEIDAFVAEINALIDGLGVDDKYYTNDLDLSAIEAMAGMDASKLDKTAFTFTWTAKTFTVKVEGADDQKVSAENLEIALPASPDAALRYDYIVGDKKVNSGKYAFTLEELDAIIAANGEYTVAREIVDVAREQLTAMVDDLNGSVGSDAIRFVLAKNTDGKYAIVMKVNSFSANALMGAIEPIAASLVGSGYDYIAMDNNAVMYPDSTGTKISLQGIVDAVMNSGVGTDTIVNVMDANGNINQMKLDGEIITNAQGNLGGELIATSLQLGTNALDAMDVDFYVTLGSAPSALVEVRNLIAGQVGKYVSAVCADGSAQVDLTMPQKAYEAFLAVLLVTDNVDFSSINDVNAQIAIGYVKGLIDPLFTGNVTTTTLTNTLKKFGYDLDLTRFESLYREFSEIYSASTYTYDEKTGTVEGNVAIKGLVDRFLSDKESLKGMIAEYETGVNFKAQLTVENLGNDYKALYIDLDKNDFSSSASTKDNLIAASKVAGLTNKLSDLSDMTGYAVVVLLDDVDGNITLNANTTILNLNGYTVNGDVVANGDVIIVDGALSEENVGTVTGSVSGNATILAGKYTSDVSKFIKSGYVQKDGVVSNEFYTLVKDSDGNITVKLDAGILNTTEMPSVQAMLVDLAAELIFNGYTTNSMYVEGNKVYDITMSDLVGIYADDNTARTLIENVVNMVDSEQLANIVNMILEDATDFGAIQGAIEAGQPVLSYKMTTGAWDVILEHVTDGDYLTASLSSSNKKDRTVSVLVTGSDADKQALADLMGELAATTTVDASVDLWHGFKPADSKNLVFDWSASANVVFDFSGDPDYAVMFCTLIADGIGAPANEALVAGIKAFYETGSFNDLEAAFNALTTSQVITAVKNFRGSDDFEEIIDNLGLTDVVKDSVVELEAIFDNVGKIAAKAVRYLDLTGGNRTMESFLRDGWYVADKENIKRSITRDIVRGYNVALNAEITEASVSVKLFGDIKAPEYRDGTGTPAVVVDGEKIAGAKVDTENMLIIIDAQPDGITAADLAGEIPGVNGALLLYADYSDWQTYEFENLGEGDLICTGTVLTATAYSEKSPLTDTVTYTIVILGDTNSNGRTEIGDAAVVAQNLVDKLETAENELNEYERIAADINCNGRVDIGDAVVIINKNADWDTYKASSKDYKLNADGWAFPVSAD